MRRFLVLLTGLYIFLKVSFAFEFMNKLIQETLNISSKTITDSFIREQLKLLTDNPEILKGFQKTLSLPREMVSKDTRCEIMLNNNPKTRLVDEAAKNGVISALTGAIGGAMLDKDKERGAVIGGMIGGIAGILYTMWTKQTHLIENYETTAKRLNYRPSDGEVLKAELLANTNKVYKLGEYVEVILRISALTPSKEEYIPVWINIYLVDKNGMLIPLGSENYTMFGGTAPFIYFFPVCDELRVNTYRIRFQVASLGRSESHEVEFKVSR